MVDFFIFLQLNQLEASCTLVGIQDNDVEVNDAIKNAQEGSKYYGFNDHLMECMDKSKSL